MSSKFYRYERWEHSGEQATVQDRCLSSIWCKQKAVKFVFMKIKVMEIAGEYWKHLKMSKTY